MVSKKAGQRAIIGAEYSVSRTPAPPSVSHARRAAGVLASAQLQGHGDGGGGEAAGKTPASGEKKIASSKCQLF